MFPVKATFAPLYAIISSYVSVVELSYNDALFRRIAHTLAQIVLLEATFDNVSPTEILCTCESCCHQSIRITHEEDEN